MLLLEGGAHLADGTRVQLTDARLGDAELAGDVGKLDAAKVVEAHDLLLARRQPGDAGELPICESEGLRAILGARFSRGERLFPGAQTNGISAVQHSELVAPLATAAWQPVLCTELIEDGAADALTQIELARLTLGISVAVLAQTIPEPEHRCLLDVAQQYIPRQLAHESQRNAPRHGALRVRHDWLAQIHRDHAALRALAKRFICSTRVVRFSPSRRAARALFPRLRVRACSTSERWICSSIANRSTPASGNRSRV